MDLTKVKEPAKRESILQVRTSDHMVQASTNPHVGELLFQQKFHDKMIRKATEANCWLQL